MPSSLWAEDSPGDRVPVGLLRRLRQRHVVANALVAVCRSRAPHLPQNADVRAAFVTAVRHHRVAPLAHALSRSSDDDLAKRLRGDRDVAVDVHITASVLLAEVDRVLDGLPWAVVKGPVLSENAHPLAGLRSYRDVDLVVAPGDLREVVGRLTAEGWSLADYDAMLADPQVPGEMHWTSPQGLLVDLHWALVNDLVTRRRFAVRVEDLLERRRQVPVGFVRCWTFDEADTLAHVGMHATLAGAHRMLLLLDVDQLARNAVDWDLVARRATAWRAGPELALVLRRAGRLLGTPIPDGIYEALGISTSSLRVTAVADVVAPVPSRRTDASLSRLVARSARSSAGASLATAATRALRGVRDRAVRAVSLPAPLERRPAQTRTLLTYLAAVEATARGSL